jgi:hypothetical protein
MNQENICPFCHKRNPPQNERCEHCGQRLTSQRKRYFTTEKVAQTQPDITGFIPSVEKLGALSKNTLALFVSGEDEPIILEDIQEIVLGRPVVEMPGERSFDLTDYGAMTLGVSRRHAQISYANGTFTVTDLDSTNGTSLNGRFLPPSYSQRLRPFDQLTLGQLRLTVYFEIDPTEQRKNFFLTDRRAIQPLSMTSQYLTTTIIPYIQALAEIQKITREVHGQPAEDIQILHIQPSKRPAQVRLSLLMNDEPLDILRQLVVPWQRIYADPNLLTTDPNNEDFLKKLKELVASIADYLISPATETELLALHEKLQTPIQFIATSGLELTLEPPTS